MTLALYKGPSIKLFSHLHLLVRHPAAQQPQTQTHSGPTWIKGVFILLTGNTFWALWLVMQVNIHLHFFSYGLLRTSYWNTASVLLTFSFISFYNIIYILLYSLLI